MKLSKYFTLEEMTKSTTAIRLGIDNTPNDTQIKNLRALCENVLDPVREHYNLPIRINSGFRSSKLNQKVGGSKTSDHCSGFAADIEIAGVPNHELADYISRNLKFTQLILEFYTPGVPDSGWVHVSYNPKNLKCEELTAIKTKAGTEYKPGLIK